MKFYTSWTTPHLPSTSAPDNQSTTFYLKDFNILHYAYNLKPSTWPVICLFHFCFFFCDWMLFTCGPDTLLTCHQWTFKSFLCIGYCKNSFFEDKNIISFSKILNCEMYSDGIFGLKGNTIFLKFIESSQYRFSIRIILFCNYTTCMKIPALPYPVTFCFDFASVPYHVQWTLL